MIEENWAGEFSFVLRDDNRVHLSWNKRFEDQQGYTMTDVGMASIGMLGDMSSVTSHLTPLKQSEGNYWGFDMAVRGDEIVLAGYHRDILTGGSWNDVTNIFMIHNDDAKSNSGWTTKMNVLSDIDIRPQNGDALAVGIGKEEIHLLYQAMRDDVTGEERVGLFYAHGVISQTPFNFQAPAGDDASMPEMLVVEHEGKDVLVAAWIQGSGRSAEIISVVQDSIWSVEVNSNISAPGATKVVMMKVSKDEIKIYHDEIGILGPVTRYGMYNTGDTEIGLSNLIGEGHIIGAGSIGNDAIVIMSSPSGKISGKKVVYLYPADNDDDDNGLLDLILSPLPGETTMEKVKALGAIGGFLIVLFTAVIIVLRRSHREEEELEVSAEGSDLELLIETEEDDGPLVAIDTDGDSELVVSSLQSNVVLEDEEEDTRDLSAELEAKVEDGTASKRLERRMKRKNDREAKEIFENMTKNLPPLPALGTLPPPGGLPTLDAPKLDELPPLPMPPAPGELPMPPAPGDLSLPPIPAPERNVTCGSCGANLTVKDMTLRRMDCPICSEVINM